MSRIEHTLRESMGLDAATIGSGAIQRTVRLRMKALGVTDAEQYTRLLESSRAEWTELVESIVVTETWFFRDQEPFTAFVKIMRDEWLPEHPTRTMRVLSVPCSSGEEPFSLAMAVRDAGLPLERLQIDAADLSARALERAQRGVFGRNSFRGKDLAFRDRHFHHTKEGYALDAAIRKAVTFFAGNLLSPDFLRNRNPYDAIFCRNLLIYFDRPTQSKALSKLERILTPTGFLFVGAAEQPLALEYGFVSANIPMAFACRRIAPAAPATGASAIAGDSLPRARGRPLWAVSKPGPARTFDLPPSSSQPAAGQFDSSRQGGFVLAKPPPQAAPNNIETGRLQLEEARRLADGGKLKEAAQLCEAYLRSHDTSAQGWYLLGLVRDAANEPDAMECYRKALYLEPNHYDTLLQMALLSEKNGERGRARTFRNRALRVKARNGS